MKPTEKSRQILYLTFRLEEEVYALEVEHLREVLDMCPITKIPKVEKFVRGIINVRGSVVPVVDLRTKFGLPSVQPTIYTRIIIIELPVDGKVTTVGAIADSVNDVLEIDSDHIDETPHFGTRAHQSIMKGIGKKDNKFIIILDINKLFHSQELNMLAQSKVHIDHMPSEDNPVVSHLHI